MITKILWGLSDETAVVLARVLAHAEHDRRNVRTDPDNAENAPYHELNARGEALAKELESRGIKVWEEEE
jgi:hypothetical protein